MNTTTVTKRIVEDPKIEEFDGRFTAPYDPDTLNKYDYKSMVYYALSRGIKPIDLTDEERKQFLRV